MATLIEISERIGTDSTDWACGDIWKSAGRAKILPAVQTAPGNGYDDMGHYRRYAKLAAGMDPVKGGKALEHTMEAMYSMRCNHEHDCCGCGFASVTVKHIRSRTFRIDTHHYRNL